MKYVIIIIPEKYQIVFFERKIRETGTLDNKISFQNNVIIPTFKFIDISDYVDSYYWMTIDLKF